MNLLKKFVRSDSSDMSDDYDDDSLYVMPDDLRMDEDETEDEISAAPSPVSAAPKSATKTALKIFQPRSHTEAPQIAECMKNGCIVLLNISNLQKDKAHRLVDFLAGVTFVLDGQMIKSDKHIILLAPAGVDVTGIVPEAAPAPAPAPVAREEYAEELYEEIVDEEL